MKVKKKINEYKKLKSDHLNGIKLEDKNER